MSLDDLMKLDITDKRNFQTIMSVLSRFLILNRVPSQVKIITSLWDQYNRMIVFSNQTKNIKEWQKSQDDAKKLLEKQAKLILKDEEDYKYAIVYLEALTSEITMIQTQQKAA